MDASLSTQASSPPSAPRPRGPSSRADVPTGVVGLGTQRPIIAEDALFPLSGVPDATARGQADPRRDASHSGISAGRSCVSYRPGALRIARPSPRCSAFAPPGPPLPESPLTAALRRLAMAGRMRRRLERR